MRLEMRGWRMVSNLLNPSCTYQFLLSSVWWEDVCEDALTSKGLNTQLRVIGGGARNAQDKVC